MRASVYRSEMYRPKLQKLKFLRWFMNALVVSPLEENGVLTRIYSVFVLILISWSSYYEISGRIYAGFVTEMQVSRTGIVIGTLNTFVEMSFNLLIASTAIALSNRSKREFFAEIEELEVIILKSNANILEDNKFIYKDMLILHAFDIFALAIDLILFLPIENKHYLSYFYVDQFYRYRISLHVLYVYCFIKELLQKLTIVNETLEKAFESVSADDMESAEVLEKLEVVVRDVSASYAKFGKIVAHFNEIFGWLLLVLFINYLCLFLTAFDSGLRIKVSSQPIELEFYFWVISVMIYALVGAVLIVSICSRTSSEARRTADLSFYYFYDLNVSENNAGQATLASDMKLLIRQTRASPAIFSAAGFFRIDYTTLFLLMNLLTSYLIVLIQFE